MSVISSSTQGGIVCAAELSTVFSHDCPLVQWRLFEDIFAQWYSLGSYTILHCLPPSKRTPKQDRAAQMCSIVPIFADSRHIVCTTCATSYVGCLVCPEGQIIALHMHCAQGAL